MIEPSGDDKQFRRGVVLGLTMAEIMLLLIFLLMLVLATRLVAERQALDKSERALAADERELAELRPVVAQLKANPEKFDIMKEWVRAEEQLNDYSTAIALVKEFRKSNPAMTAAEATANIKKLAVMGQHELKQAEALSPHTSPEDALARFNQAASIGSALRAANGDPRGLLASAASCTQELQTCKGQNVNLSNRLGGVLPPCWVDHDGKAQYIFDARLREDGIWLKDNKVPGREIDQAQLPLAGFTFDHGVEVSAFWNAGGQLFALSQTKGCRFYVNVYDETGPGSKLRYKELLAGVEEVFYKKLR